MEATVLSWPSLMATTDDGRSGVSLIFSSSNFLSSIFPRGYPSNGILWNRLPRKPLDGRMQVDYSIELGPESPALEFPWASDDGTVRYYDLKQHPDLVLNIEEARNHKELSEFLSRINAASSPLQTAKCDTWFSRELFPEEEVFGASCKFACHLE